MPVLEDEKIVELYLNRHENAIRETREKYGARLNALANGIVEDTQTAEECENDTYLAAWNSIPPHEPRNYLYAFLARIARHIALNRCRDNKRLKRNAVICELTDEMEQCIPAPDDGSDMSNETLSRVINNFLAGLGREKRNIFVRRYWYLDSIADISKRFKLSESKIKTTLFRCREQLRERLKKEGYTV